MNRIKLKNPEKLEGLEFKIPMLLPNGTVVIVDKYDGEFWSEGKVVKPSHLLLSKYRAMPLPKSNFNKGRLADATLIENESYFQKLTIDQNIHLNLAYREHIVNGGRQFIDDSDEIGNKHTYVGWGLCSGLKPMWSHPELQKWPGDERDVGKDQIYGTKDGTICPFDERDKKADGFGCYHHCRIFNKKVDPNDKETALKLYDLNLERLYKRKEHESNRLRGSKQNVEATTFNEGGGLLRPESVPGTD